MEVPAKVSAKGQVTIPKKVRDALSITGGEEVLFRIEDQRAVMARYTDLLGADPAEEEPASQPSPATRRIPWDAARHSTARRHPNQTRPGAVLVRDTDGSPLTIELIEKSPHPSRR
jgi:AbrB family looped-hinge helix DNA binding protein